jgi:hypothetical protein
VLCAAAPGAAAVVVGVQLQYCASHSAQTPALLLLLLLLGTWSYILSGETDTALPVMLLRLCLWL